MNEKFEQLAASFRRQVISPLERLGRAIKRQVLVDGLAVCLGALVALGTAQFLVDRLLVLGVGPRIALLMIVVGVVGHQLYRRVLLSLGLRVDVNEVAAVLERRNRAYADRLASAVAFSTGAGANPLRDSPSLVSALLSDSLTAFPKIDTRGVLRRDRLARRVAVGLGAAAVAVAAFAARPDVMTAYLQRNWLLRDAPWPVTVKIVAEGFRDGALRWPIGDELKIVAKAVEGDPAALHAEFEFESGETFVRDMDRLGETQFILDYGPLVQAMRLRFVIAQFGVDERTEWYRIDAVSRPGVRSVRIEIEPPAYSELEPFALAQGLSSADVIRGSSVRIDAEMNKPITRAALKSRADDKVVAETSIADSVRLSTLFVPERKGTYYFDVEDADGLDDRSPVTYSFNLLSDPPPKARLTLPGVGEMVVPGAQLRLAVDCEDQLGIQSVSLLYSTRPAGAEESLPPRTEPLPDFTAKQRKYATRHTWPLLPLTLKPGDQLTLQVRATDYQPAIDRPAGDETPAPPSSEPAAAPLPANLGESIRYTLRVVTPEELLAELGRRENEWRREFEQIIKAQEQLNFRVVELREASGAEAVSGERAVRYGQESRTQRQQSNRVRTVLRQFRQILDEMEVNELASPAVRRRLQNGVIDPLRELMNGDIAAAADLLDRLRGQFDEETAVAAEEAQTQIVRKMYAILADMLKWEGYNEAVALVREVVRLQQDVNDDTKKALEAEIEKLFGEEPSPASRPAREEQP